MSDKISILVPTWNRSKFLPLLLHNIKSQDYPHELLTVVIDDDGDTPFIDDDSIVAVRNDLIKSCPTKIFAFMDDDDVYMNTYISYSYSVLKDNNLGCVGSDKMLFTMSDIDFDIHMIDCGNTKQLIHEATLMMTRKWYNASCKFGNNSKGEGSNLFYGHERTVGITDISKVMICLQHDGNTVDKLQFAKDDNKLDIKLSPELIEKLKSII